MPLAWTDWMGWTNWFEPEDLHRRLSLEIAERAVVLDPDDGFAHLVLGWVLKYEHRHDESAAQIELGLRIDPNNADLHARERIFLSWMVGRCRQLKA